MWNIPRTLEREVNTAVIAEVKYLVGSKACLYKLTTTDDVSIEVTVQWVRRYRPKVGDILIQYDVGDIECETFEIFNRRNNR